MPCLLVFLKQYVKFRKYGDVFFKLIKVNLCSGFRAGVLVM